MSLITARKILKGSRGFTLAEILIASIVGTMVIASAWSVYVMVWQWWAETSPRLDAERSARLALLNLTEGVTYVNGLGYIANPYVVNGRNYYYRNGIAWADEYPVISADNKTITYSLMPDSSSTRQFYPGTYNGQGVIYYRHTDGASYRLDSTLGVTDLRFENLPNPDDPLTPYNNVIKVTVTARKEVYGTRADQPFIIEVEYSDTVYLRNAL
jgi:hypothetical protein